jgi:hypothetical protein
MRLFKSVLIISTVVTSLVFFSCEKSESEIPETEYSLYGLWEGTYMTDQVNHAPTYIAFTFYEDGTLIRRGKAVGLNNSYAIIRGKYSLNRDTIVFRDTTLDYIGGMQVDEGFLIYNKNGTMSEGVFESIVGNYNYSGTFQNLKKVK